MLQETTKDRNNLVWEWNFVLAGNRKYSNIYANPQHQEQEAKTHEEGGHEWNEQLLCKVSCELSAGDFINKEPSSEESPDQKQENREMWVDGRVNRWHVTVHGLYVDLSKQTFKHWWSATRWSIEKVNSYHSCFYSGQWMLSNLTVVQIRRCLIQIAVDL